MSHVGRFDHLSPVQEARGGSSSLKEPPWSDGDLFLPKACE